MSILAYGALVFLVLLHPVWIFAAPPQSPEVLAPRSDTLRNVSGPMRVVGMGEDGWLLSKTTVKEAEEKHLVSDLRLGPTPVPFGFLHGQWLKFKASMQKDDELWRCAARGMSGLCIVRGGAPIASIILRFRHGPAVDG